MALFISIHKTPLQVSIFVRCAMCVLCVYVGGWMNECVSFSLCPNEWTNKTWLNFTRCVQKRERKKSISNVFYSTYELIIVSRRWRCDFQQSRSMFRLCHLFMLFSYYNLIVIISSIERWQSGRQAGRQTSTGWLTGSLWNHKLCDQHFMICTLIFVCWCNRQFDFFSYFRFLLNRKRDEQQNKDAPFRVAQWELASTIHIEQIGQH